MRKTDPINPFPLTAYLHFFPHPILIVKSVDKGIQHFTSK